MTYTNSIVDIGNVLRIPFAIGGHMGIPVAIDNGEAIHDAPAVVLKALVAIRTGLYVLLFVAICVPILLFRVAQGFVSGLVAILP